MLIHTNFWTMISINLSCCCKKMFSIWIHRGLGKIKWNITWERNSFKNGMGFCDICCELSLNCYTGWIFWLTIIFIIMRKILRNFSIFSKKKQSFLVYWFPFHGQFSQVEKTGWPSSLLTLLKKYVGKPLNYKIQDN